MTYNEHQKFPVDLLTVFGIALIVVSVTVALHEAIHACTCLLTGGTVLEFSAQHVKCDSTTIFNSKLVSASAAIVNMIIGVVLYWRLQRPSSRSSIMLFMMWLFMFVNFTSGVGYLAFSGISGVGDYANVIEGWEPAWLWRTGMSLIGLILFMICVALSLKTVGRFIGGSDIKEQVRRLQMVCMAAFSGALLTAIGAAIFNPHGITGLPAVAGIIAIAGGQSPLLWMAQWFNAKMFVKSSAENNLTFGRSWPHIIAGVIALAIYAVVLGPGFTFSP